jgi:gamma-aminobutyric acid receptor subunit rho
MAMTTAMTATAMLWCATVARAQGACSGPATKGALRTELLRGYDKYTAPKQGPLTALNVSVGSVFKVLESVSAPTGSFRAVFQVSFGWNDPRLAFNTTSHNNGCFPSQATNYPSGVLDEIWTPAYYFSNQIDSFGTATKFLRIKYTGDVTLIITEGVEASCDFTFARMPFDRQKCFARLVFLIPQHEAVIESTPPGTSAVVVPYDEGLGGTEEWSIVSVSSTAGSSRDPPNGSTLQFEFEIERASSYWVGFVLAPSIFLVMLSYGTFYIQRTVAPARAAFCFVCYLTMINLTNGALASLPKLGASDVLLLAVMSASQYFCACTILIVVIANYLLHIELRVEAALREVERLAIEGEPVGDVQAYVRARCGRAGVVLIKKDGQMFISDQHVDIAARYIFPVAYAITIGALFSSKM